MVHPMPRSLVAECVRFRESMFHAPNAHVGFSWWEGVELPLTPAEMRTQSATTIVAILRPSLTLQMLPQHFRQKLLCQSAQLGVGDLQPEGTIQQLKVKEHARTQRTKFLFVDLT